jgi:outer membrane lipoprotein SlyB
MKKAIISIGAVVLATIFFNGCATSNTAGGAVAGAAVGGLAGAVVDDERGAVIGAAGGAVAGAMIGKEEDDREREARQRGY